MSRIAASTLTLYRRAAFPPVVWWLLPEHRRRNLHLEVVAERPQLLRRPGVLEEDDGEGVKLAGTVTIDSLPNAGDKGSQLVAFGVVPVPAGVVPSADGSGAPTRWPFDRAEPVGSDRGARPLGAVPTCPGWTVADLVRHLANGYINVVVRRVRMPEPTPVQDLTAEPPLAALRRCHAAMVAELTARDPGQHVGRQAKETVYFWIRRMAHETAIHRVDVEIALAEPVTPIPRDLALDGVEEMLRVFLDQGTRMLPEDFTAHLRDWASAWVLVSAGDHAWRVTLRPDRAVVEPVPGHAATWGEPAARVYGEPDAVLRWLYNRQVVRGPDDRSGRVHTGGDQDRIAELRRLLTAVTNVG